ncbi:type II toxin-antitoxin system RelE/ParE family toxin [Magnetovibrio sp. PR-2]|uniref:type II toxin-antitoxin system RelE/ParE family toxin n=1 Tax=Magnetovibrio sp. PR-2 TaxID=3120356 RepID=UPI002FCE5EDA
MVVFKLSDQAKADLRQIGEYTLENFGAEQKAKYAEILKHHFRQLAQHPESGQVRDDWKENYRSFPAGRHMIVYRITDGGIEIVGIPHQSRDLSREN